VLKYPVHAWLCFTLLCFALLSALADGIKVAKYKGASAPMMIRDVGAKAPNLLCALSPAAEAAGKGGLFFSLFAG